MGRLSRGIDAVRRIGAEVSGKNVPFMAAGIAYNAFLSLAPILVVLLVVVSAVGGGLEQRVVEVSQGSLPGPIADVIAEVFQGGAGDPAASVVGVVVLLWGTLKIFRGLDTAFSEIYETTEKNSFLSKLVDGLIVLVALVVAIVATIGVTILFAALSDMIPYIGYLTPLVLVTGLIAAFFPMYYRFPDTDVQWRHVLPGAAFAAVGWAAFQAVFQVYLSFSGGNSDSLFGGVIVVITWLYFSGMVLLIGAVINAVLGGYSSGKEGGVGRGAGGYETEREETMRRDELSKYLYELRKELTGRHGNERPGATAEPAGRSPPQGGEFEVLEQYEPGDEDREWRVEFRWEVPEDRAESEDEAERAEAEGEAESRKVRPVEQ